MKEAMAAVMDWLGAQFDWLWQKVSPVIDALRRGQGKGAAALQSLGLSGGDAGPELRYESRGGYKVGAVTLRTTAP